MGFISLDLNVYNGIAIGFLVLFLVAALLDKLGDALFRRGIAKPFYIRGHRVHHRDVLLIALPLTYALIAALVLLGDVRLVSGTLWTGLGNMLIIAAACLGFDLALDYGIPRVRWGILHHELIYLLIPAYAFTGFIHLAV
jgi:hypothetical protein